MTEQPTHRVAHRPINPAPDSVVPRAEATEPPSTEVAGVPAGQPQSVPERGTAGAPPQPQPQPGSPPPAETGARSAEDPKGPWTGTPGGGSKADTGSDDVGEMRRDGRYLETMVRSVPRAAGEDGRDDLALAREIDSAVEPNDIFDRWRVEDLFHSTREVTRYRSQRVALPHAARFGAIVALLMPYKNVFNLEATKTAADYLGLEPKERKQAENFLRILGITDAAINAQAAELHERSIAAMDRLIAQGQTRRSSIVREVERDKRRAEKAKAKKSKPDRPDQPELALH